MRTPAAVRVSSLLVAALVLLCGCNPPIPGISVYKPEKCDNGYTLLTSIGRHENPPGSGVYHGAILVDMDGTLVREWEMLGMPAKMLPGGRIMGFLDGRDDGTGHLEWDALVIQDWFGNEQWRWDAWEEDALGNPTSRGHHDFQRQGNPVGYFVPGMESLVEDGRSLLLVHENVERPDIAPWTLEDDVILEVDAEGNIVWQWQASDHLDAFGFDADAREALQTVQVVMPGLLGGGADVTDWLHTNSISYVGPNRWWDAGDARFHPGNIIADSRSANILWIIEKATGEIVWKVGPDYSLGRPEWKLGQMIGQHHAHVIPRGLPGEGNILVFDNGGTAGYGKLFVKPTYPNKFRTWSRVVEFDPVSLRIVWEYKRRVPLEGEYYPFFSYYISGAQRLPNGNTLITEGSTGRVFEVTADGELVWEYVSPYLDWSFDHLTGLLRHENDIYRAYRVPYEFIPPEYRPGS